MRRAPLRVAAKRQKVTFQIAQFTLVCESFSPAVIYVTSEKLHLYPRASLIAISGKGVKIFLNGNSSVCRYSR